MDTDIVVNRAPLSERMRNSKGVPAARAGRIWGWADEVAALEARLAIALSWQEANLPRLLEPNSPVDTLKQNYEKLGLSSALAVNKKYGKRSTFGYQGRE